MSNAGGDITFGRAEWNAQPLSYSFQPTEVSPNAARVIVRKTTGSPNGALPLFFADIFGTYSADVKAEAIAMVKVRDISVVADLSGSHSLDSRLRNNRDGQANNFEAWDGFPGGIDDAVNTYPELDPSSLSEAQLLQVAGPAWGYFWNLGYGMLDIDSSYDPNADDGLVHLPRDQDWSNNDLRQFLSEQDYADTEINAIISDRWDDDSRCPRRVAVALGFAEWNSGMPGGLWEQHGAASGDNDDRIDGNEIVWVEPFGSRSADESAAIWQDYINGYVARSNSKMAQANSNLRYKYGAKTFIDYLLEELPSFQEIPELANASHQPMQAVKDAVGRLSDTLTQMNNYDRLALEVYGTRGRHEMDLTHDFLAVGNHLAAMQAEHYESYTNIGAGILHAQGSILEYSTQLDQIFEQLGNNRGVELIR